MTVAAPTPAAEPDYQEWEEDDGYYSGADDDESGDRYTGRVIVLKPNHGYIGVTRGADPWLYDELRARGGRRCIRGQFATVCVQARDVVCDFSSLAEGDVVTFELQLNIQIGRFRAVCVEPVW